MADLAPYLLDPNYQPGPAGALQQGGFYAPPVTQLYRGGILAQPTTQLQTGWLDAMPESPMQGDWSAPGGEYKPNLLYPAIELNEGGMQARPEFKLASNMLGQPPSAMSQFSTPTLPQGNAAPDSSPAVMPPPAPQDPTYAAPGPAPAPQANPDFEIGNLRMPGVAPQSSSQSPILGNSDAGMWGLLAAGLGILANTQGSYGSAAGPIGKGGLMGVQTYLQQREQNVQNLAQQQRLEIAKREQAAREAEYSSQAAYRNAQVDSMREESEAAKAIGAALGGGSGPGAAPVAPMVAPQPMPGQGTVLAPGIGTPGTPGGPPAPPVSAGGPGGVFDPNFYARAAVTAFDKGSMKQGEKMLGLAKDMASLAQSGVHIVDSGDQHIAIKVLPGGGTQVLGAYPKSLSPDQVLSNIEKSVASQQKAVEIGYNTGTTPPVYNFGGPTAAPNVTAAPGPISQAPAQGNMPKPAGVPMPEDIFKNVSPKDQGEIRKQSIQQGQKELETQADKMQTYNDLQKDLQRWQVLNAKASTGPVNQFGVVDYIKSLTSDEYQEMKRLENKLSMNNFKPGQGQISNFERSLVKGSGPNTQVSKAVNDSTIMLMGTMVANMQDKNDFQQAFLAKHQTLNLSSNWWNDYINSNPRFVQDKDGNLTPNASRMDWQSYLQLRDQGMQPMPLKNGMYGQIDKMRLKSDHWYITPKGPLLWKSE